MGNAVSYHCVLFSQGCGTSDLLLPSLLYSSCWLISFRKLVVGRNGGRISKYIKTTERTFDTLQQRIYVCFKLQYNVGLKKILQMKFRYKAKDTSLYFDN